MNYKLSKKKKNEEKERKKTNPTFKVAPYTGCLTYQLPVSHTVALLNSTYIMFHIEI
jgi:hypothetical protein